MSAKADEVFGYSEVLNYQGGNVMELENIILKHWESKGGLEAFRNHVLSQLNLGRHLRAGHRVYGFDTWYATHATYLSRN